MTRTAGGTTPCAHRNCTIDEYDEQLTEFEVVNGSPTAGTGDEPTGRSRLEVVCHDCGLMRTYRDYKKYPKWLKTYLAMSIQLRDDGSAS